METINDFFTLFSSLLWGWPMVVLLLGTHLFLTFRLGIPQRKLLTGIRLSMQRDSGATGVLGQPGKAKGVDWASLYKATDAVKLDWYIVECESNPNTLEHIQASFEFLHKAGRC